RRPRNSRSSPHKMTTGPAGARSPCLARWESRRSTLRYRPALCGERRATATARFRVRIDEREAARQPFRHVVQRRAVQIEIDLRVTDNRNAVDLELLVMGADLVVELERVRHPGAPTTLDPHPEID